MLTNTLVYFILLLLTLLSICGYGLIYNKNETSYFENPFTNIFAGHIILVPISFIINLISSNVILNLLIFLLGIFFYFFRYKKKYLVYFFSVSLIFFSGLVISKTHEDFSVYHFQHINEISQNYIILGLANLDIRYTYASIFAYLQSLYKFPIFDFKTIFLPIYSIYVSLIGYLFFNVIKKRKILISVFFLILLIVKFKRLSEFGYDYIGQFLLIYIFIEFIFDTKLNKRKFFDLITLFLLSILIKITNIYFLPVILISLLYQIKNINLKQLIPITIPILSFLLIFSANSFIKTGCLNYLIKITCNVNNHISWNVSYEEINEIKSNSKSWARGYFHQKNENKIENEDTYNKSLNWIPNWLVSHFKIKILDYLIILLIIYFLINTFSFTKLKTRIDKNYSGLFFALIFSCLFWLYNFPQFRLGFASISILFFLIIDYFFKSNTKLKTKQFIFILAISIVYFNYSNVKRISEEFSRDDIYKFTNFPFFPSPNLSFDVKFSDEIKYRVSTQNENFWRTCWNIQPICVNHDDKIKITKLKKNLKIEKIN